MITLVDFIEKVYPQNWSGFGSPQPKLVKHMGVVLAYTPDLDYALIAETSTGKVFKVSVENITAHVQDSLALRANHK